MIRGLWIRYFLSSGPTFTVTVRLKNVSLCARLATSVVRNTENLPKRGFGALLDDLVCAHRFGGRGDRVEWMSRFGISRGYIPVGREPSSEGEGEGKRIGI
jgi:hypothetical protein